MGISKRDLFECYYYDEFLLVLQEHNKLHAVKDEPENEEVFIDQLF